MKGFWRSAVPRSAKVVRAAFLHGQDAEKALEDDHFSHSEDILGHCFLIRTQAGYEVRVLLESQEQNGLPLCQFLVLPKLQKGQRLSPEVFVVLTDKAGSSWGR